LQTFNDAYYVFNNVVTKNAEGKMVTNHVTCLLRSEVVGFEPCPDDKNACHVLLRSDAAYATGAVVLHVIGHWVDVAAAFHDAGHIPANEEAL